MKDYHQITFKNGETLEFASKEVAEGYVKLFGLKPPVSVK